MANAAAHGARHRAGLNSPPRPARDDGGPFHATFLFGRIAGVQVGAVHGGLHPVHAHGRIGRRCAWPRDGRRGLLLVLLAGSAGGLWLALIGLFVSGAARAETSMATTRSGSRGIHVSDAMVREPELLRAGLTIADFVRGPFSQSRHASYPVRSGDGRVGLLFFRDVERVPPDQWERATIGSVTAWEGEALAPDDDLGDALVRLSRLPTGRALVLEQGALAGLLSMTDVSRLIELRRMLA